MYKKCYVKDKHGENLKIEQKSLWKYIVNCVLKD